MNTVSLFQMYHNSVLEFYIVTTDENECNWMMFVRKARYDMSSVVQWYCHFRITVHVVYSSLCTANYIFVRVRKRSVVKFSPPSCRCL